MWNLGQLIEQNNRAALEAVMTPAKVDSARYPQPEGWSLTLLADILQVGPPKLSEIITCLEGIHDIEKFVNLVVMLLPEYETEIMTAPRNRRVYKFCYFFGKKYYPLPANMDCPPAAWTEGMPVQLLAMSYSEYHDLAMRTGYLLLLSLVVYPYEGDERDLEDDSVPFNPVSYGSPVNWKPRASDIRWLSDFMANHAVGGEWIAPMGFRMIKVAANKIKLTDAVDNPEVQETIRRTLVIAKKLNIEAEFKTGGRNAQQKLSAARVPLLDKVRQLTGEEIYHKIPAVGWEPEDLRKMTDGTRFEGVGEFADWACSQTGCVMLDTSFDNCDYVEGNAEPVFKWSKYNVETLTTQWPKVQDIRAKIDRIVEWLELDPINNFNDLVNFLLDCKVPAKVKRVRRLYDSGEHFCDLDMDTGEEEENDDN